MPASLKHSTVLRAVTRGGGGGGEGKEGGQKNYGVRILPVTHAIGCSGGPPRNPSPQPKHIPIPRPSAPPALARITLIAVFLVLVSVSHDDTLANTATHALPECISSPHVHPHTTEYPGPPTIDPITNLQPQIQRIITPQNSANATPVLSTSVSLGTHAPAAPGMPPVSTQRPGKTRDITAVPVMPLV